MGHIDQVFRGKLTTPGNEHPTAVEATIFARFTITFQSISGTTIGMSKIRKILRMYIHGRSIMSISAQADASRNTVKKYLASFKDSGFTFEKVDALNDKELEDFFGKSRERLPSSRMQSMLRCFPHVDKELKRTGVNRQILWKEYYKEFPDGYQYSQFCFNFNQWKARVNPEVCELKTPLNITKVTRQLILLLIGLFFI